MLVLTSFSFFQPPIDDVTTSPASQLLSRCCSRSSAASPNWEGEALLVILRSHVAAGYYKSFRGRRLVCDLSLCRVVGRSVTCGAAGWSRYAFVKHVCSVARSDQRI